MRHRLLQFAVFVLIMMTVVMAVQWRATAARANALREFPRVTLWAWESPQDLRALDTTRYSVAYLDASIFIGEAVRRVPRMQPLQIAAGTKLMAVVRIEAPTGSAQLDKPGVAAQVADAIVVSARKSSVAALQIDFDATRSQQEFYTELLREVRRRMPKQMPLSITALASWCGSDSWMRGLPVDEAVPMFFRMGRERPERRVAGWSYPIHEPLCATSAGVSTDEVWPKLASGQRVYVFHPGSWSDESLKQFEEGIAK